MDHRRSLLVAAVVLAGSACADAPAPAPASHPLPVLPAIAAQTGTSRLSLAQYRSAIHDLFGDDIVVPAALEPDTSLAGFVAIGAAESAISPRGVEQYEDAAFKIAAQLLDGASRRSDLVPCQPAGASDVACARRTLAALGRRVWRRPLEPDELATLTGLADKAGLTLDDFYEGLAFGIAGLLQSPHFLYRPLVGEPDPAQAGRRRYTSWEMASRLSFFLWNGPPDDELLDAAAAGELTRDTTLAVQAARLLASPKARRGLRNFVSEYLRLDQLDQLSKDPQVFTTYNPDVGPDAREETLRDFEYLAFDLDGDYTDLLTARWTFVNPKLASMYEVEAPNAAGFGFVSLPEGGARRGLLGQASILALYAHPTSSSATLRGKFVRQTLLCATIPPPPVNVNTALPEPVTGALTLREREKVHLSDPFCASCHQQMDPIGLGLENFDGIGRFRVKDHGEPIDPSGDLDGAHFAGASDLGAAVKAHPGLAPCFARRMYEYATAFVETGPEAAETSAIAAEFQASGHKIKTLMLTIALSPGFRLAREPQ